MSPLPRNVTVYVLLAYGFQSAGCAHYHPMSLVFVPRQIQTQGHVRVQLEEYYSPERGKLIFDADLGKHGVFRYADHHGHVRVSGVNAQMGERVQARDTIEAGGFSRALPLVRDRGPKEW